MGAGVSPQTSLNLQIKHAVLVADSRITCNERRDVKLKNRAYFYDNAILENNDLVHMRQILHSMSHKNTRLKEKLFIKSFVGNEEINGHRTPAKTHHRKHSGVLGANPNS